MHVEKPIFCFILSLHYTITTKWMCWTENPKHSLAKSWILLLDRLSYTTAKNNHKRFVVLAVVFQVTFQQTIMWKHCQEYKMCGGKTLIFSTPAGLLDICVLRANSERRFGCFFPLWSPNQRLLFISLDWRSAQSSENCEKAVLPLAL